MMEDKITIEKLNLYYSDFHALHDINMHIQKNEITAFIGPSDRPAAKSRHGLSKTKPVPDERLRQCCLRPADSRDY